MPYERTVIVGDTGWRYSPPSDGGSGDGKDKCATMIAYLIIFLLIAGCLGALK
jgi:hypothetical protein